MARTRRRRSPSFKKRDFLLPALPMPPWFSEALTVFDCLGLRYEIGIEKRSPVSSRCGSTDEYVTSPPAKAGGFSRHNRYRLLTARRLRPSPSIQRADA